MKLNWIFLFFLLVISCSKNRKTKFSMIGITSEIENGTLLYLKNTLTDKIIDSTIIENNSFYFNSSLSSSPLEVLLFTEGKANYRYIWLEDTTITFNASNNDFRNAFVTGSKTENLIQNLEKGIDTTSEDKMEELETNFIMDNPHTIASASILSTLMMKLGKEKTQRLFNQFSNEIKKSEYGKKIDKFIKLNKTPKIGERFIDFEMKDNQGKSRKLSDLTGEIVLLEFWASWCQPCRIENKHLVETYGRFKDNGFEIFAVSSDSDKKKWLDAIEKDNMVWRQVSELNGDENKAVLIYGVNQYPYNFLIDREGIIVGRNLRGEELNNYLKKLLND